MNPYWFKLTMKNSKNEKEKSVIKDTCGFYEKMPRFVHDVPDIADARFLSPIQRMFEWSDKQFTLLIVPACGIAPTGAETDDAYRDFFPGDAEEIIEKVLRRLAVAGNINFDAKNSMLCFSLTEITNEYPTVTNGDGLTRERLEKSLDLLSDVKYVLKQGIKELHFRPIEGLRCVEISTEVYYRVCFTPFFFDRGNLFNRIFGI